MILQLLIISCISTSLMTTFSYGVSAILRQQFREPELLNLLAIRIKILNVSSSKSHPLGWIVHYVVGIFFILLIEFIRIGFNIDPLIPYYIVSGAVCGFIGVGVWVITFKLHPSPPKIRYTAFYIQLIFAHIIFGIGIWISLPLFSSL